MSDFDSLPGFLSTPEIDNAFEEDSISTPTEAQTNAFAGILAGQHVVIDSGTGTGKTLAYLLPLLQKLRTSPEGRVVCLAPAAELAVQTLRVASRYKAEAVNVGALVGGGNQKKQKDRVTKSTRLVVGTPGRVLEMVAARKLKGITTFVLDEPEPILSAKDADFLLEVLSRPPRPQLIVAGATFGAHSARLIERLMGDGFTNAKSEERPLQTQIEHLRVRVRDAGDRDLHLARLLEREKRARTIVYVNQAHLIRHLYRYLMDQGMRVVTVNQERNKEQCKHALRLFAQGDADVLLTTDRAATGIDIADVELVVHYELPRSAQAYVHRAGRSGRAGKKGRSLVFAGDQERIVLKRLQKELEITFAEYKIS